MAKSTEKCSFCGRQQKEVRLLISGANANICNDCINAANDIVAANTQQQVCEMNFTGRNELPKPAQIKAITSMVDTGVDGMTAFIMRYPDGSMSVQRSSVVQTTRTGATIYCEKCTIEVPGFWHPTKATVTWKDTGVTDTIEIPLVHGIGEGFYYECEEVMRCLDAGLNESPLMTLDDSVRVLEQLDTVRAEIGLKYPFEK